MTYTKKQLATILSALDGRRRNPESKDAAMAAIIRRAEQLGMSERELFEAATGLLEGTMSDMEFRGFLDDEDFGPRAELLQKRRIQADICRSQPDVAKSDDKLPMLERFESEPPTTVHAVEDVHLVEGEPCPSGHIYRAPKPCRERQPRAPRQPGHPREGSKEAMVIEMLRRREGATILDIAEATGWQHHTVRGFLAAALKKRHGLQVTSEKTEKDQPRVYRVA